MEFVDGQKVHELGKDCFSALHESSPSLMLNPNIKGV